MQVQRHATLTLFRAASVISRLPPAHCIWMDRRIDSCGAPCCGAQRGCPLARRAYRDRYAVSLAYLEHLVHGCGCHAKVVPGSPFPRRPHPGQAAALYEGGKSNGRRWNGYHGKSGLLCRIPGRDNCYMEVHRRLDSHYINRGWKPRGPCLPERHTHTHTHLRYLQHSHGAMTRRTHNIRT